MIPQRLKEQLKKWILTEELEAEDWLFSGQQGDHYSIASLQMIVKAAKKKAKIMKEVHPHTFRHSFATHLIQNGYAVTEVQPLMGRNKLETTMVYLHMASLSLLNVKSPLDSLGDKA